MFFHVKLCKFLMYFQCTMQSDKTQMFYSLFFRERDAITVALLVCDFYKSWSTRFVSLKLCVFHFPFRFVFLKFTFLINKVKIPFKVKIRKKGTHSLASRPLIFKFQQKVWKFNDICVSWSSQKTDMDTTFLNLQN